jgi:hypothetical protein
MRVGWGLVSVVVALMAALLACSSETRYEDPEGQFSVVVPFRWETTTQEAAEEWAVVGDPRFQVAFAATLFRVEESTGVRTPTPLARFALHRGTPRVPPGSTSDERWLLAWAGAWIDSQPAGSTSTTPRSFIRDRVVGVEVETLLGDTHQLRRFYRLAEDVGLEAVCSLSPQARGETDCAEVLGRVSLK